MDSRQIEELLRALPTAEPATPADPTETDLSPWRQRIDGIDRIILALLNERSKCANAIGHIKRHLALPVYVPEREEQVLANVRESNPGPLPARAVTTLFERIIDETRSLERRIMQEESDDAEKRTQSP